MATITFKKQKLEISVSDGSEFVDVFQKDTSLPMKFGCTRGICGVCAMEVTSGMDNLTKKSDLESETLKRKGIEEENYRLGCQCAVNGSVEVSFVNYSESSPE